MNQHNNLHITSEDSLLPIWPYRFFEKKPDTGNETIQEEKSSSLLGHGVAVRCANCNTIITYQGNAESIAGNHVHKFVNPGGYEFVIACYQKAWCKTTGQATTEWTWFSDCSWQYALCPQCHEHLGWFYQCQSDSHSFYGLILNRLLIDDTA